MNKKNSFEIDFDSYIRQGEPDKKEKSKAWSIATGLQQVDGLTPSAYLYETARRNIEGEISIKDAKKLIDSYYESKSVRAKDDGEAEEADKVSARIAELLSEKAFTFTPNQLLSIHERLFKGIFYKVKAGKIRDYNITKKEWALNGDTVLYANFDLIKESLKYDFETEKKFDYSKLSKEEAVKHLARFVANIWQIHPFGEGNTRTTAVFTIKYLQSLGFDVNNEAFEKHSWYFRNALVRANYTNMQKGIYMNAEYLEKFFRNILLGESNELKNRYTNIDYKASGQKSKGGQKKWSENMQKVFDLIKENPHITRKELCEKLNINPSAVQKHIEKLKSQNAIKRIGGAKGGHWEAQRAVGQRKRI